MQKALNIDSKDDVMKAIADEHTKLDKTIWLVFHMKKLVEDNTTPDDEISDIWRLAELDEKADAIMEQHKQLFRGRIKRLSASQRARVHPDKEAY